MSEFSHLRPHENLRALTLSGGGVRGILSIQILKELEEAIGVRTFEQFDLMCGTSIGGILCLGLAIGRRPIDLAAVFKVRSADIFGFPRRLNPFGIRGAKHNPSGLREVVSFVLGSNATLKVSQLDKAVVIVTVNASKNCMEYFGNVTSINGVGCMDATLIDIAMATSAAPSFFPPHRISSDYYVDGGLVSNNPDLEAYLVGTEHFCRTNQSLKILSIGTGRHRPKSPSSFHPDPGKVAWLRSYGLVDRLISLQEQKPSSFVASQLEQNYWRIDAELDRSYDLDDSCCKTLTSLENVARETAKRIVITQPAKIAGFFR